MAHEIKACQNKQANTAPSWKCMQMKMNTLSDQREEGAGAEGFYCWSSEAHTDCKKHIWVLIRLCLEADEQPSFAAKLSFSSQTIIWFMLLLVSYAALHLKQTQSSRIRSLISFRWHCRSSFSSMDTSDQSPSPPPLFKTVAGRGKKSPGVNLKSVCADSRSDEAGSWGGFMLGGFLTDGCNKS